MEQTLAVEGRAQDVVLFDETTRPRLATPSRDRQARPVHTNLDDARLVVAQLLYLLDTMTGDGELIDVPAALCDLGPVEMTPEGVQQRMETLVAGASRALLTVLDLAAERGLEHRDALRQAALLLAADD